MKIKTFEEWVAAVEREYVRFSTIHEYLNADGTARLNTFRTLSEDSCFASTASEMLSLLEAYSGISKSRHAAAPIRALKMIADQEKAQEEENQRRAFREKKHAAAKTLPKGSGHAGRKE